MKESRIPINPLMWLLAVVCVIALLPGLAGAQASAPAAPAPTTAKVAKAAAPTTATDPKTCTTPECHAEVKAYKFVHGPVNVDACDACHKISDPAKHKFEDTRPKNQECVFCHKMDISAGMTVHAPVKAGDCLPCHNPHGGKTAKLIRGDTMLQTCNQCHKDVVGKKSHIHGPVAAGDCEACHSPHASKNAKLLLMPGKDLCLSCHKEMGDQLRNAKVAHKPVVEGECTQCHDPHASDFAMQVKAEPFKLCTGCHEHDKVKQAAMDAKYKHSVVTTGQACLNCHTPHGGPLASLMKAEPADICVRCHKDPQKAPDGRTVNSVAQIQDPALFKHGPVREGSCNGCHNAHGSEVQSLLAKSYPPSFYAPFSPDNFALCFSCHDKKLVETKEAVGLTGFRNGAQNLHSVHVDREKGRTCRACHETHASQSTLLIRNSVPFGQWELPINFKKTDSGGSCAPGCHKEYRYDRNHAADNVGTAAPATAPASGLAPVIPTAPVKVPSADAKPAESHPAPEMPKLQLPQ